MSYLTSPSHCDQQFNRKIIKLQQFKKKKQHLLINTGNKLGLSWTKLSTRMLLVSCLNTTSSSAKLA